AWGCSTNAATSSRPHGWSKRCCATMNFASVCGVQRRSTRARSLSVRPWRHTWPSTAVLSRRRDCTVPSPDHDGIDLAAFAPHPDDVELFCGGTMLVAAAAGLTTAIVDLTDGELSTNGTLEQRARERDEATGLMRLAVRRGLS